MASLSVSRSSAVSPPAYNSSPNKELEIEREGRCASSKTACAMGFGYAFSSVSARNHGQPDPDMFISWLSQSAYAVQLYPNATPVCLVCAVSLVDTCMQFASLIFCVQDPLSCFFLLTKRLPARAAKGQERSRKILRHVSAAPLTYACKLRIALLEKASPSRSIPKYHGTVIFRPLNIIRSRSYRSW